MSVIARLTVEVGQQVPALDVLSDELNLAVCGFILLEVIEANVEHTALEAVRRKLQTLRLGHDSVADLTLQDQDQEHEQRKSVRPWKYKERWSERKEWTKSRSCTRKVQGGRQHPRRCKGRSFPGRVLNVSRGPIKFNTVER